MVNILQKEGIESILFKFIFGSPQKQTLLLPIEFPSESVWHLGKPLSLIIEKVCYPDF